VSSTHEAIRPLSDATAGVTTFIPSDYLLGEFEQLCATLASMTPLERRRWLGPALRRFNAWERSTLIGALRFLIASMPKDDQQPEARS